LLFQHIPIHFNTSSHLGWQSFLGAWTWLNIEHIGHHQLSLLFFFICSFFFILYIFDIFPIWGFRKMRDPKTSALSDIFRMTTWCLHITPSNSLFLAPFLSCFQLLLVEWQLLFAFYINPYFCWSNPYFCWSHPYYCWLNHHFCWLNPYSCWLDHHFSPRFTIRVLHLQVASSRRRGRSKELSVPSASAWCGDDFFVHPGVQ
jgi:hypothetical protein